MGKGSSPKAPDPWQTAEAQRYFMRGAAEDTARFNQMGINSPWGRQYYTGRIGSPDRQMHIELSPDQQRLLDYQNQLSGQLFGYGTEQLAPAMMERLMAPDSTAVEDALYERGLERLQPELERREARTQSDLMSGGIPVGSRAYGQEMNRLQEREDQALENLALSSRVAGAQENRLQRQQAIQELSSILGQIPGMQSPATMMPGAMQVGAPDFAGGAWNQYGAQMGRYNQRAANLGGLYGMLGLLGAGALF